MTELDPTRPEDGHDGWTTPLGLVTLTAPAGVSPYYRLFWHPADGGPRQQTSGGRTFETAWRKALAKEADLEAGAGHRNEQPCEVAIDYWLDPARPTPRGGWGDSHRDNMRAYADRYFGPGFGQLRCMDLRRKHLQAAVNAAPTFNEGANIRRAASSLLAALRLAAGALGRGSGVWWRGLMVEVAAYSGPRWSELVALTADRVHEDARILDVLFRVDYPKGKAPRLVPPKMSKRRTTVFPDVSPTGYPLEEMLRRRVGEARVEQAAGTNPLGLLFPAGRGGFWLTGNFHRDLFEKAATHAGWDSRVEVRPHGPGKTRQMRKRALTWHSLRHTFCTVALDEWDIPEATVALLAGHADTTTTRRLYVGASEDAVDGALERTKRRA